MATEYKDYYKLLGVKREATQEEIKKAYRRQARKHHPDLHASKDRSAAENKFKEINEAYQVLGDPENRKKYDRLGANWKHGEPFRGFEGAGRPGGGAQAWSWSPDAGGAPGGFQGFGDLGGFSDFFQQLFGDSGQRPGARRGRGARGFSMPGEDAVADVEVTLDEVLNGTRRSLHLSGLAPCSACGGSGLAGDKPCTSCRGSGQESRSQTIEVRIPPGISEGGQLRVRGKGNPGMGGGDPGDLLLRVHIAAHPVFQRVGNDLQVDLPLWPWEAVLGKEVTVPVLDGSVKMKVPAGSQSGTRMKLRGKGLPGSGGQRGDQYVVLKVVVPKDSTPEERDLYQRLAELRPIDPRGAA
ncbi:MAG: DnaJ C-terminal domain-containing protein [bacterium]